MPSCLDTSCPTPLLRERCIPSACLIVPANSLFCGILNSSALECHLEAVVDLLLLETYSMSYGRIWMGLVSAASQSEAGCGLGY